MGMAAAAFLLGAISFWLLWDGAGRMIRKVAFREALGAHDSEEYQLASDKLDTVMRWDKANPLPRILMAKIHVEKGNDEEAQALYEGLAGSEAAPPEIHAGLGGMYLRQAFAEADKGKGEKLLADADAAFGKAGALPEAGVGRAWVKLVRAVKNGTSRAEAAKDFAAALEAAKSNPPERAGVEDLYAGLAVASYDAAKWNKLGADAAKAYHTFNAKSETALANVLLYEAQYLEQGLLKPATEAEVTLLWADMVKRIQVFLKPQYSLIKEPESREALMDYTLAAALWMTQKERYQDVLNSIAAGELDRPEFYTTLRNSWFFLYFAQEVCAARPFEGKPNIIRRLSVSIDGAIAALSQNEVLSRQNPDYIALALQFQAYGDYMIWKETGGPAFLPVAAAALNRALKLVPGDYRIQRNLAFVLWANKQIDEAIKMIPTLEEAAKTPEEKADLEEAKKYLKDQ